MLAFIESCGLSGIEGYRVTVEVNLARGMPLFEVVGLPDASVKESRERVRAALKNSGVMVDACKPQLISNDTCVLGAYQRLSSRNGADNEFIQALAAFQEERRGFWSVMT